MSLIGGADQDGKDGKRGGQDNRRRMPHVSLSSQKENETPKIPFASISTNPLVTHRNKQATLARTITRSYKEIITHANDNLYILESKFQSEW